MNNSKRNIKIVFGVSIAAICVSSFVVIISLLQLIYVCIGFNIMSDENALYDIISQIGLGYETYLQGTELIIGHSQVSVKDLLNLGLGLFLAISILELACGVYELVTAIISLKNKNNINKYKLMFCMTVVAAISSLLSLNFINMILFIIIAVLVHITENTELDKHIKEVKKH